MGFQRDGSPRRAVDREMLDMDTRPHRFAMLGHKQEPPASNPANSSAVRKHSLLSKLLQRSLRG